MVFQKHTAIEGAAQMRVEQAADAVAIAAIDGMARRGCAMQRSGAPAFATCEPLSMPVPPQRRQAREAVAR
jgi:hypothetical protein